MDSKTTFVINKPVYLRIEETDSEADIKKLIVTIKNGDTVLGRYEMTPSNTYN